MADISYSIDWTENASRLAPDKWSRILLESARRGTEFRRFSKVDPELSVRNEGGTFQKTFVKHPDVAKGPTGEHEDLADVGTDWWQASFTPDEFTGKTNRTRRAKVLSVIEIEKVIREGLARQLQLDLDLACSNAFKDTGIKCGATAGGAADVTWAYDGTFTSGQDTNLNYDIAWAIKNHMEDLLIEPLDGQHYGCLLSSRAAERFTLDDDVKDVINRAYAGAGKNNPYIKGYIGECNGVMYWKVRNSALLGNSSNNIGEAIFFGKDPVAESRIEKEEIGFEIIPGTAKRRALIYHYFMGGFRINQPIPLEEGEHDMNTLAEITGIARVVHFGGLA